MGNCTSRRSGKKKKTQGDEAQDDKSNTNMEIKEQPLPSEDVTYASIDHSNAKTSGGVRATADDDCDYAIVTVPSKLQPEPESETSSKEDCADDYVLMG
ncbi:uncharacterized protein LOC139916404 [Centroberyx gerrardi]|uniref:uncharacterized protein n=1 Tax=Centroberyx gerrardi TaxID=166262 RepID=UPI003AAC0682